MHVARSFRLVFVCKLPWRTHSHSACPPLQPFLRRCVVTYHRSLCRYYVTRFQSPSYIAKIRPLFEESCPSDLCLSYSQLRLVRFPRGHLRPHLTTSASDFHRSGSTRYPASPGVVPPHPSYSLCLHQPQLHVAATASSSSTVEYSIGMAIARRPRVVTRSHEDEVCRG